MTTLKRGPVPYYHQISTVMRDRIANGEFRPGDKIPTEDELQQLFSVSCATVRQALQSLERDGLVKREAGRGSFVRYGATGIAELKMTCLLEDLIELGIPAKNRVSDVSVVAASRTVAQKLGIDPGQNVFTFLRIVAVEDQPFAVNRGFLHERMAQHLSRADLADAGLLRTLEKKCGVAAARAEQVIEAILADTHQASLLNVGMGSALLSVARSTFDHNDACIEYSVTLYRSDRTRFSVMQRHSKSTAGDWVLTERGARGSENARATLPSARRTRKRAS